MGAPLAPWAEYTLGVVAAVMFVAVVVGGVWVAISRHRDPRWEGVHRGPVAHDFHEATGDIPVVTVTPEPVAPLLDLDAAATDVESQVAQLLDAFEWWELVTEHGTHDFEADVTRVCDGVDAFSRRVLEWAAGVTS